MSGFCLLDDPQLFDRRGIFTATKMVNSVTTRAGSPRFREAPSRWPMSYGVASMGAGQTFSTPHDWRTRRSPSSTPVSQWGLRGMRCRPYLRFTISRFRGVLSPADLLGSPCPRTHTKVCGDLLENFRLGEPLKGAHCARRSRYRGESELRSGDPQARIRVCPRRFPSPTCDEDRRRRKWYRS